MCGIVGGFVAEGDQRLDEASVRHALARIEHRGPDDAGVHIAEEPHGGVFLGMRRLSILDIGGGHQPIFNEDGSVAVVFNGEIYNYRELIPPLEARGHVFQTRSDTEVLVHLWEEHGEDMCAHLRGMFAFAIWDKNRRVVFVARDRFGKKPLYMTRTRRGGLLFASELKALRPLVAQSGGDAWSIRPQSIYDYLSLGVIPQEATVFEGVETLPAASWMRFDGEQLTIRRYWSLDLSKKTRMSYAEAQEETRRLLREAVRLRLRSDVPLGVFLSSGMDSSIVAFEAAREVGAQLQTFTVGVKDARLDESPVARRTAATLGVQNTVLHLDVSPLDELQALVRHYDQPFSDSSAIPSLAISRQARQHVTVVLNGDGGDELFAGYRRHVAARMMGALSWVPRELAGVAAQAMDAWAPPRRSIWGFAHRFVRGLAQTPGERYLSWTTDMLAEPDKRTLWNHTSGGHTPTEDWIARQLPANLGGLDTQLAGDHRINLLSDLLVKMDMATMAASLEGRSPFMDHVLAEHAASLPDSYRVRHGTPKSILRDAYRGLLPDEVVQGAKRGFEIPMNTWLRDDLRPLLMDTLAAPDARVARWIRADFIADLLAERVMRERNWTYITYSLLVLELWLRDQERAAI